MNGFNEVSFNFYHWEDLDYSARCNHAGYGGKRIPNKIYRIQHQYGQEKNRGPRAPEKPFPDVCSHCAEAMQFVQKHVESITTDNWSSVFSLRNKDVRLVTKGCKSWYVCQRCNFILPEVKGHDLIGYVEKDLNYTRAPVNVSQAGRNLRRLSDDIKGKSWDEKIEVYAKSWSMSRYLTEDYIYEL